MKAVDRWLKKGRKNCKKGNHWFIMDFGDHLLCPVCGKEIRSDRENWRMTEYNAYLVNTPQFEKVDEKKNG